MRYEVIDAATKKVVATTNEEGMKAFLNKVDKIDEGISQGVPLQMLGIDIDGKIFVGNEISGWEIEEYKDFPYIKLS